MKKFSKEDLLAEAKRRYPEGSKIKGLMYGKVYVVKPSLFLHFKTEKEYISDGYGDSVYLNGKWAEIVQDTLKVSDLVEGEVYKVVDSNNFWMIGKHLSENGRSSNGNFRSDATYIDNKECFYLEDSWCYKDNKNRTFKLATQEEAQWLEACISANKFIPKEEALKSKDNFKLPKYWYCELTDESRDVLNYWRKNIIKYSDTDCSYKYIWWNGWVWGPGGGEITFQQFLSHVWSGKEYYDSLNKKEEVPEYYEHIDSGIANNNFTKGIYTWRLMEEDVSDTSVYTTQELNVQSFKPNKFKLIVPLERKQVQEVIERKVELKINKIKQLKIK